MHWRSIGAAFLAMVVGHSASGIINGTPVPASDRRFDCIGSIHYYGNLSGGATLIAPGVILTSKHLMVGGSSCSRPDIGQTMVHFRLPIETSPGVWAFDPDPIEIPVESWEYVKDSNGNCYDFAIGYFDPNLLAGVQPMALDLYGFRPQNFDLSVAGFGTICDGTPNIGNDGTLRWATSPASMTPENDLRWTITACCGAGCGSNPGCSTSPCGYYDFGTNDSGSPKFVYDPLTPNSPFYLIGVVSSDIETFNSWPNVLIARLRAIVGPGSFSSLALSYPTPVLSTGGSIDVITGLWAEGLGDYVGVPFQTTQNLTPVSVNSGNPPSDSFLSELSNFDSSDSQTCEDPGQSVTNVWEAITDRSVDFAVSGGSTALALEQILTLDHAASVTPTPLGSTGLPVGWVVQCGSTPNPITSTQSFTVSSASVAWTTITLTFALSVTGSNSDGTALIRASWKVIADFDADGIVDTDEAQAQRGEYQFLNPGSRSWDIFLPPGNYILEMIQTGSGGAIMLETNCGVAASMTAQIIDSVEVAISQGPTCTPPSPDPVLDAQACVGSTKILEVNANTSPAWYLWLKDGVPLYDDLVHIDGAHESTLTITGVVTSDEGIYDCQIFSPCGGEVVSRRFFVSDGDYNRDGIFGDGADVAAFYDCLGGDCCPDCQTIDQDGDNDYGTSQDIDSFWNLLTYGHC